MLLQLEETDGQLTVVSQVGGDPLCVLCALYRSNARLRFSMTVARKMPVAVVMPRAVASWVMVVVAANRMLLGMVPVPLGVVALPDTREGEWTRRRQTGRSSETCRKKSTTCRSQSRNTKTCHTAGPRLRHLQKV